MDQIGKQNIKTLSHEFIKSQFLKKVTQLLLSVSLMSLFFSHTSLLSILHSNNFYFSTFPFQLFTHTIDKNYIFLLCNGLLVFVVKYPGLISSSSSKYNLSDHEAINGDLSRSESVTMESNVPLLEKEFLVESNNGTVVLENAAVMEITEHEYYMIGEEDDEEEEKETEIFTVEDDQEQKGESGFLITKEEEEEESGVLVQKDGDITKEAESSGFSVEEEEEEEVDQLEEGNGMLSTEELNKKFDDFIRKMKEELRIEAKQQLVMVQ